MANILTQEENDQNNKEDNTLNQVGGLSGTTASTPTQANAAPKPKGSGRFTNIQKYLGANQNAGEKLGKGIREKGDSYLGSVREGIESAKGVQQGITDEKNRIGQAGQLGEQIQTDSVAVAQNNLDDVTKLRLGQNQATQLQGQGTQALSNLQQNINPLDQFGQNLGTESGRFQVLQDTFGGAYKPQYNMGQRRLDQLLLQASPDSQLQGLQSEIGNTVTDANKNMLGLQENMGQGINDIRYGSQQAQQDILNAIGTFNPDQQGAFGSLYSDFGTEQQARENELASYLERARSQLGRGNLDRSTADMLGITGGEGYGVMDLQDYANKNIQLGDTDVTMADVADRSDLSARLNALSQLSGTQQSDYDLGLKEGSDINFNYDNFANEANRQVNNYEDEVFKKSLYDAEGLGRYNDGMTAINNVHQSPEQFQRYQESQTVDDLIRGYVGHTGNSSGIFRTDGYGGGLANDLTSRQQIQMAKDYADAKYHPTYRSWYKDQSNQFGRILDYLDSNRNNRLRINEDVADLETGGNFNVS